MKFVLGRVENIVEKGENAGYQCFQKASYSGSLKVRDCVVLKEFKKR